jgi:hypothetical protein
VTSVLTIPRVIFYPCITIFAIVCCYIGYSYGVNAVPLGFEIIELPVCIPDAVAPAVAL